MIGCVGRMESIPCNDTKVVCTLSKKSISFLQSFSKNSLYFMDKRIRGTAYTIVLLTIQGFAKEFHAKSCTMPTNSVLYRVWMSMSWRSCFIPRKTRKIQSNKTVLKLEERNKKDEDKFASFCNVHKLFEELEKLKK